MKQIYLIRHAKSSWKTLSLNDIDRPLNKRGKRDAPFMAQKMVKKGMQVDAFWASPSKRTQATAHAFALALNYPLEHLHWDKNVYEATASTLLKIIQEWKDDWQKVALFAHNFACTDFANYYALPLLENVPTTGVVHLQFTVSHWSQISKTNGQVLDFEYPRLYFPKKTH
ncbi:MAG: SixA phosphatase family protein [Aureispira sp.]